LHGVRLLALLLVLGLASACNDVRGYEGTWSGPRVGNAPVLNVGLAADATATLAIDGIDTHGVRGHLSITNLVDSAEYTSVESAEADVLSSISFNGSPTRVYLAFFGIPDDGGDGLAVIALYDDKRVEVRIMRGGPTPLYGIFALTQGAQ
jgi:hypothetical protein